MPYIYAHEHMRIDLAKKKQDFDCDYNAWEEAKEELYKLQQLGVEAIVDCSNLGMGRDISVMKEIQKRCGIKIYACTGYYKEDFFPEEVYTSSKTELANNMIKELREGVADYPIDVIGEIGTSYNCICTQERKVFEAAAIAHRTCHAPIITHTTLGSMAMQQAELLKQEGVDLRMVLISHVALKEDFIELVELLHTGVNIAFDTIGKKHYLSDEKQAEYITKLVYAGYQKQIVLSMDITRRTHVKAHGGWGYTYLIEEFIPHLQKHNISEEAIFDMTYMNMKRILSGGNV